MMVKETQWKNNLLVVKLFVFGVNLHTIILLVTSLIIIKTTTTLSNIGSTPGSPNVSAIINSYTIKTLIITNVISFPVSILLTILTYMNPWRHEWTFFLWHTSLASVGVMITCASFMGGIECFRTSDDTSTCTVLTRPVSTTASVYGGIGPILVSILCRNKYQFQIGALIVMTSLYLTVVTLNKTLNTVSSWFTLSFLIGTAVVGMVGSHMMDKVEVKLTHQLKKNSVMQNDLLHEIQNRKHKEDTLIIEIMERKAAQERANLEEKKRNLFTAYLLHEIRNPLQNSLQIIDLRIMEDEDEEVMHKIKQELISIGTIVNDSLDISRMDDTKMTLLSKPLMYHDIVNSVIWVKKDGWVEKGLEFKSILNPVIDQYVILSDENRLKQILQNFLSNAIKFTEKGEISLRTEVISTDSETFIEIKTLVTDSGYGITPENQKILFKPYVQISPELYQGGKGSGLGLAICAGIINAMRGTYGIESRVGEGSTFWFQVKFQIQSNDIEFVYSLKEFSSGHSPRRSKSRPIVSEKPERVLKILITDDNQLSRELMKRMISRMGHDCETANDGREGVDKIQDAVTSGHPFDILFIDNEMPVLTGLEAIKELRSKKINIKIVSISGSETVNTLADMKIMKPCGYDDIKESLNVLSRRDI
jgi:signal transduction histidine kinase